MFARAIVFALLFTSLDAHSGLKPWVSLGPQLTLSNDTWPGAHVRGGFYDFLDDEKSISAGVFFSHLWSLERIDGRYDGRIYRSGLFPNLHFQQKESLFWIRGGLGAAFLGGAHPGFVAKIKESFLVEVGRDQDERSDWSVSFAYQFTGRAQNSVSFFADNFGRDADATGDLSGIAPRAHLFSLNLNYKLFSE